MRICYLADAGSVLVQMRVGHFAQKDHEVHLISFRLGEVERVKVHYIKPPIPFSKDLSYILSIPKIKRLVMEITPDILHAYHVTSYGLIGTYCRVEPFIISCIGSDINITPQKSILHKWLTTYALKKATAITSVSRPITEEIIKLGIAPQKIQTFPFGIDPKKFSPAFQDENKFALLSLRSLKSIYNIETILQGLSFLKKEKFEGRLAIVGGGPEEKKLKRLAKNLEISDHVVFVGAVPHDNVNEYLQSSQIYLSLSFSDGASNSLFEAMACGVFPVVSDIPANREWICDGDNGFLVPVKDPKILAYRIKEVLSNQELRRRGIEKNIKVVQERANFQKNMPILEELYRKVIKEK